MTSRRTFLTILAASPVLLWLGYRSPIVKSVLAANAPPSNPAKPMKIQVYSAGQKRLITTDKVIKTEAEWQKTLTPEQFNVLRQKGTERAFTGQYWNTEEKGIYSCSGCANNLYSSDTKFDSGTGWPSFWKPIARENISTGTGNVFFGTEVNCARCDGHLGHVFNDGPKPTGLRYCMNSVAMSFAKTA